MQTKYVTKKLLKNLFEIDSYYYIEGTCPELCKFPRLLQYANNILINNEEECNYSTPNNAETAFKIIEWFGEEVYLLEIPPQSIDFITEE